MPTSAPSSPTRGRPAVLIDSSARMPSVPNGQAERAADDRQHHALGEQLADDAAARAAERGADRDLALAARGAHQQQVRDVRARDQQHEADGAEQHEQRLPHVADEHLADRIDAERCVRPERVLELRCEVGRRRFQPRLRLLERDAGLQAARASESSGPGRRSSDRAGTAPTPAAAR